MDAGGWFDGEIGRTKIRNRSATSTRSTKTRPTPTRSKRRWRGLSEMVARRLREHQLYARTVQLKLRYSDFSTITRAQSLDHATQLDTELPARCVCFSARPGTASAVRLLGVHAGSLEHCEGQMNLLEEP